MPRKGHPLLGDREWLKSRIDAGKSQSEIAAEAGLTSTTMSLVAYYVRKHGLQTNLPRPERVKQSLAKRFPHGRFGEKASNWRGGRMNTGSGYVRIYMPEHPQANHAGYVYEHRFVMEQKLGRLIKPEEIVDHIDRNRSNNAPENLRIHASRSQHVKDHYSARDQMVALVTKLRAVPYVKVNDIRINRLFQFNDPDQGFVALDDLNAVLDEAMRDYTG
jgi:hypothetical protein